MNHTPAATQAPTPLIKTLALSHRGACGQVAVAAILITVLPALILTWAWSQSLTGGITPSILWGASIATVGLMTSGYALLVKYPVNIVRLRSYLGTLAAGNLPEQMHLSTEEDDLAAIQNYMTRISELAEERITILNSQHQLELEAERQRVMIESIGAMCHHLGQPASEISMCLYLLRKETDPARRATITDECQVALDAMSDVLNRLRSVTLYRAEDYLPPSEDTSRLTDDMRIISI